MKTLSDCVSKTMEEKKNKLYNNIKAYSAITIYWVAMIRLVTLKPEAFNGLANYLNELIKFQLFI